MSRDTENFSMYSDMSTRMSADGSAKRNLASARASSVLPTPVGPEKMNEPMGRFGSLSPARERRMARDTARMASSCPTTEPCSSSSMRSSREASASWIRVTGMPVHRETMKAMASSSITGRRVCRSRSQSSCRRRIWFWRSRSRSRSDAARSKFWSRTASSLSTLTLSRSPLSAATSAGGACDASRARAPASSITSMALSGRNRSVM